MLLGLWGVLFETVIFVLFFAAYGGAITVRTFKCTATFDSERVVDTDCNTRQLHKAKIECIMQKWSSCWNADRVKLNTDRPGFAYPANYEPQLPKPQGNYRGDPSSEKKILKKLFDTGKISDYKQTGADGTTLYGVRLPQNAAGDGFAGFELMQLDIARLLATDKAFRNAYFSTRLATVSRGAAFGASTLQYLWNSLHHKDLKKLKDIMLKYEFFEWIDENLEFDEKQMFPGNVLRTLERHMFRCQGYYGVPSHYQIPMCYYGRWSAQLFSSCKLTHWRHGPEANDVFDFTSIVNPNVQAYKTFTQRSTPYVDGGNVFVRVFKFPDVGDGQGEFVWKKYHFDFFLTNSGIIMKGAFKNPLGNNEFEILTRSQIQSNVIGRVFGSSSRWKNGLATYNRDNRANGMQIVLVDKWKGLKGVFITIFCHDNPIFANRWGTPAECMDISWTKSRSPGYMARTHFTNTRGHDSVGLLASMPFGIALGMPREAELDDLVDPHDAAAGTWLDVLIGRMFMEHDSPDGACPFDFLDSSEM